MTIAISLTINGRAVAAQIDPRMHLADFLRERLDLTGTHLGCEHGVCGACTLLIDGATTRNCVTLTAACDGAEITTIEGLDDDEIARQLRAAFSREHALQCGYCTPGMIMAARDAAIRLPDAGEQAVRVAMSSNLCRCTGYVGIVRATQSVIAERRAQGHAAQPGAGRAQLGPVGSGRGATGTAPARAAAAAPAQAVKLSFALDDGWVPQVVFDQSFEVAFPVDEVWEFFGKTREVARCLPGAEVTDMPGPDQVEGLFRMKVGPISAHFSGAALIERKDASHQGRIVGAGQDSRSASRTRGQVLYTLAPIRDGAATRVDLSVGYTLTGMLAQFGRSGLVRDISNRLVADFARNLEARLSGAPADEAQQAGASLNGIALVWAVIRDRVKRLLTRAS